MKRIALSISAALVIGGGGVAQGQTVGQRDPRAVIFVQRGCNACHGIWGVGLKPKADVGPDLTFAYVDVRNRYGMSLEAFLYNPSGVMRMMLASHLKLTATDRDSISHILEGIFKQHRAELSGEIPPIVGATLPPN
jgi:hypothetical protein